ncbi:MAG: hypothetical protein DRJ10_08320 [Bacteroidetes bacterium]|nr:MAG: hypothetical protein DRJ10_08320 [Bacteroidota bacterium]
MKKLKKKFQKKKPKLVKIKKLGRWCEYYVGRIPFPIECQWNQVTPLCQDRPNCVTCNRRVTWQKWKDGIWDKIKYAISQGDDLTDMPSPELEGYEYKGI